MWSTESFIGKQSYIFLHPLSGEAEERVDKCSDVGVSKLSAVLRL
jgi:hypothetical protein